MKVIEIFTDIGSTEDEINEKYPPQNELIKKIHIWLYQNKQILMIIGILIIIYLFNNVDEPVQYTYNQSGGGTMSKLGSPIGSTFSLVTSVVGRLFRMVMLIVTIILIPTIPILLYCLVAYYIIKKFLFMITSIK
jgi:hypothetical protein